MCLQVRKWCRATTSGRTFVWLRADAADVQRREDVDTSVVGFDYCARSSQPNVIRMRHRNLCSDTQFDPKWFEWDLLHRIPQVIKHPSSIPKLTRTVKAAWQPIQHFLHDTNCSVAVIHHRTKSRKRFWEAHAFRVLASASARSRTFPDFENTSGAMR